jgi:hypothetical protein
MTRNEQAVLPRMDAKGREFGFGARIFDTEVTENEVELASLLKFAHRL